MHLVRMPLLLSQVFTETRCVALNRAEPIDPLMLRQLNRLSDALFMLGRWLAHEDGEGDVPWLP